MNIVHCESNVDDVIEGERLQRLSDENLTLDVG